MNRTLASMLQVRMGMIVVISVALLIGATAFVWSFDENLHCTQYTSFRIATFDMEAHEEEAIEGLPLVYGAPYAAPLRVYFAGSLLAFLYVPALTAFPAAAGKFSKKLWRRVAWIVAILVALNMFLPGMIVGERFRFLTIFAVLLFAIPTFVLFPLIGRDRA
ncbi:MAG TPA: hypothetical protein VMU84_21655 [Thermoanaerobaculia bacterium]|nr:hypothetical protein [Thermoanaerobaculia bacterium]